MAGCLIADIRLCNLAHFNGSLYTDIHTALLQRILQGQRIDGGCQHAHIVCTGTLHLTAAILDTTPEVPAADNNADLCTNINALFDYVTNRADYVKIQSELFVTSQCFTADFNENTLILRCIH